MMFMNLSDKLKYSYIKNIKRYMMCPSCNKKMQFSKSRQAWICNNCRYTLDEKEFLDDYVFWFCDECGVYLNDQDNFDRHSKKHICTNCGFENDTCFDNVKGMCRDCGKILKNPDLSLCEECRKIRQDKAKTHIVKLGKIAGAVAVAAGAVYLAVKSSENDEENTEYLKDDDYDGDDDMKDYPICRTCGSEMTDFDGWAWYTCPECGDSVRIIDGTETWKNEIFGTGKKEFHSDFELADFCHGGDLTED